VGNEKSFSVEAVKQDPEILRRILALNNTMKVGSMENEM
jgi:hypothetical protein